MGGFASIVRGALSGLNQAAGNTQTAANLDAQTKAAQEEKQAQARMAVMPHFLAIKGLQTKLQALNPQDPGYADQSAALTHDIARNLAEVRGILHPEKDPKGNFFERGITDKLHLSSLKERQDKLKAKQASGAKQDESGASAIAQGTVPYTQDPKFVESTALETQRTKAASELEDKRLAGQKTLEEMRQSQKTQKESKPAGPLEAGGVPYAVRGDDGKEYLPGPDGKMPPGTPHGVTQIWDTIQSARKQKELEEQHKEERLNRALSDRENNVGTWSVVEGDDGQPKLMNSKTGQMKDTPHGLHKSGYYAKNIAPLEAANLNISSYMDNKVFDGPGDLALQHEFFTATQPSAGFRMTKVQQDILQGSQSWINSIKGKAHHLATGTWFSDEQRRQIAKTAQEAIDAKKKSFAGEQPQGGMSDDDFLLKVK